MTLIRRAFTAAIGALAMFAALTATAVNADDHKTLSGVEITATVSDYTINGTMVDTGRYTEFYAADGTIRGEGYTGVWTVENDTMCFKYGEDPAACWTVGLKGEEVLWIVGGEVKGTGTRVKGNVNNF